MDILFSISILFLRAAEALAVRSLKKHQRRMVKEGRITQDLCFTDSQALRQVRRGVSGRLGYGRDIWPAM